MIETALRGVPVVGNGHTGWRVDSLREPFGTIENDPKVPTANPTES